MDRALEGVRIFDLSRYLPGPFATLLLRDLGAEVIKVEQQPGPGDLIRAMPLRAADGQSVGLHALNRGKRSVGLDLRTAAGRAQLMHLLGTADVLLESFRPGVLARMLDCGGEDESGLQQRFPRLIVCHISAAGQSSPLRSQPIHDMNAVAAAGLLSLVPVSTSETRRAAPLPVPIADYSSAYTAALLIVAALRRRDRGDGRGTVIDVSMMDCAHAFTTLLTPVAATLGEQGAVQMMENGRELLAGGVACYNVYACGEALGERLACGCLEVKFWEEFVELIGVPHLASDAFARDERLEDVRQEVEAALSKKSAAEWAELCFRAHLPVNRVEHISQVDVRSSHTTERPAFSIPLQPRRHHRDTDSPTQQQLLRVSPNGFFCDGKPVICLQPAPRLGEANAELVETPTKLSAKL